MRGMGEALLRPADPEFRVSQGGKEPQLHLVPDRHVTSLTRTTEASAVRPLSVRSFAHSFIRQHEPSTCGPGTGRRRSRAR